MRATHARRCDRAADQTTASLAEAADDLILIGMRGEAARGARRPRAARRATCTGCAQCGRCVVRQRRTPSSSSSPAAELGGRRAPSRTGVQRRRAAGIDVRQPLGCELEAADVIERRAARRAPRRCRSGRRRTRRRRRAPASPRATAAPSAACRTPTGGAAAPHAMRRAPGAQVLGRTGAQRASRRAHQQLAGDAFAARRGRGTAGIDRGARPTAARSVADGAAPSTYSASSGSRSWHLLIALTPHPPSAFPFRVRRSSRPHRWSRHRPSGPRPLVAWREPPRAARYSARRPREILDITVPIGTSSTPAISAYVSSSTSRSHTACRKASGSASSAACRSASSVARVSICSGGARCADIAGGLLHGLAVDVDRVPPVVPAHVPERVVEDREQPRLQVRAALELRAPTETPSGKCPGRDPRHRPAGASAAAPSRTGCPRTTAPRRKRCPPQSGRRRRLAKRRRLATAHRQLAAPPDEFARRASVEGTPSAV